MSDFVCLKVLILQYISRSEIVCASAKLSAKRPRPWRRRRLYTITYLGYSLPRRHGHGHLALSFADAVTSRLKSGYILLPQKESSRFEYVTTELRDKGP